MFSQSAKARWIDYELTFYTDFLFTLFKSWYIPYSAACQAKQEHRRARLFPLPVGLSRREFCCLSMPLIICDVTRGYQSKRMLNQWPRKRHKNIIFCYFLCVDFFPFTGISLIKGQIPGKLACNEDNFACFIWPSRRKFFHTVQLVFLMKADKSIVPTLI